MRKGLLAAEKLAADLDRLEAKALELNVREFELERAFSLAQVDAAALLELRRNGSAQVTLREAMYDLDHPGLLMRRLRRVGLSVPAVAGPYVNVNASLRLEKAWLRVGAGASATDASSVTESSASVVLSTLAGRTEILTSSGRDDDGCSTAQATRGCCRSRATAPSACGR